jgi:hypothetical protein
MLLLNHYCRCREYEQIVMVTKFLYYDFAFPNKLITFHEIPLNMHYLFAGSCIPGGWVQFVYMMCVCVCANSPGPSHITPLAGSSVTTPVQFSRLTASDHSGRLHLDVDNKPAEDYVQLTTSVCFGSTHWQLEPQLYERKTEVREKQWTYFICALRKDVFYVFYAYYAFYSSYNSFSTVARNETI